MKRVIAIVAVLLSGRLASAQELPQKDVLPAVSEAVVTPPPRAVTAPAPTDAVVGLDLVPVRQRVRRRRTATLSLLGAGAALTLGGGLMIGFHNQADSMLVTGISFTTIGASAILTSLYLGTATAGRDAGVERVRRLAGVPVTDRLMLMDELETDARHGVSVGLGLLIGGTLLSVAGAVMCVTGVGNIDSGNSGNSGLFLSGLGLSIAGDAMWFTGSFTLSYYGGKVGGIKDARRAIAFAPTGVSGTF